MMNDGKTNKRDGKVEQAWTAICIFRCGQLRPARNPTVSLTKINNNFHIFPSSRTK